MDYGHERRRFRLSDDLVVVTTFYACRREI
jgi:hypothetical protein